MKSDFITIPASFNELGLPASEKIALSLIYGFDKSHNGVFYGSISYVQTWLGCTKPTAIVTMKKLIEKGLVNKSGAVIDGEYRRIYTINWEGLKNFTGVKNLNPEVKKFNLEGKEILPNNIVDNIDDNINNTLSNTRVAFVKPSIEEISAYIRERGCAVNADTFYNFYESKGWMVGKSKMKDWKACVRSWEQREKEQPRRSSPAPRRESVFEHNIRVGDRMFGTNMHEQLYGKRRDDE